ncbi:4a-hydroxytetrahydrobiopterin dehydratase [Micrococcus sp. UYEF12]|uniref:4a-hydroxytetrahydrobiopterin dehydratase n=1 Tax=Micrococcus sp. UYEF12 TaxID=1756388 RepID=UPI003395E76F
MNAASPRGEWRPGTTVTRPERPPTPEEIEAIVVLRRLAHERVEADWHGGPQPDGTIHLPWATYDKRIWTGLDAVQAIVGVDREYRPELAEPGLFGPIEQYTRDELASVFMWVVSGERFSDGHVNGLIHDGTLAVLLDRLAELMDTSGDGVDTPVSTLDLLAATPALRPLDPADVAAALAAAPELAGWAVAAPEAPVAAPPELAITYATGDFATALALADRIGEAAEAADHHPDLAVSYGRLGVRMHSHDVRALTSRDVRLARTVARLAAEVLAPTALAAYGTLAPGRSNAHVMDGVRGPWTPGTVRGVLHASGAGAATGYPGVVLATPAAAEHPAAQIADVPAQLLVSVDLPDHWDRLDAFEGAGYRRVPAVVALDDDAVRPAYLYELVPDAVPPSA